MAVDEQDVPASVARPAAKNGAVVDSQNRLEALLLDDSDSMQTVASIADQEVKVVGGNPGRFGLLILLLLFCVALLLAGGYYLLNRMPESQPLTSQPSQFVSPRFPIPARSETAAAAAVETVAVKTSVPASVAGAEKKPVVVKKESVIPSPVDKKLPLFAVMVGPFLNSDELKQATSQMQKLGFQPQERSGRGQVAMIRLLEGVYPAKEARQHQLSLDKVTRSAFLLSEGGDLAVYAGSFHQEERAQQMVDDLAQKSIDVTMVRSEVTMKGTMLVVLQADRQTAREVAAHVSSLGFHTQLQKMK